MVIFHSYVNLPEGRSQWHAANLTWNSLKLFSVLHQTCADIQQQTHGNSGVHQWKPACIVPACFFSLWYSFIYSISIIIVTTNQWRALSYGCVYIYIYIYILYIYMYVYEWYLWHIIFWCVYIHTITQQHLLKGLLRETHGMDGHVVDLEKTSSTCHVFLWYQSWQITHKNSHEAHEC